MRYPARWLELTCACPYRLRPLKEDEAQAVRVEMRKLGYDVDKDSPVGANDALLLYAALADKGIAYVNG